METHSLQSAACVIKARIGQLGASYLLSKACLPVCGKEIMWHWAMYVCVRVHVHACVGVCLSPGVQCVCWSVTAGVTQGV